MAPRPVSSDRDQRERAKIIALQRVACAPTPSATPQRRSAGAQMRRRFGAALLAPAIAIVSLAVMITLLFLFIAWLHAVAFILGAIVISDLVHRLASMPSPALNPRATVLP
jgi:hypothetical protein